MITEKHHVIPISVNGHDVVENLTIVSKEEHVLIHKTLNIAYQYIREFREKTNHKLTFDKDYFVELRVMHCAYFRKIDNLPDHLVEKHVHSLELQIEALEKKYGLSRIEQTNKKAFDTRLYQYHTILWAISQKIQK